MNDSKQKKKTHLIRGVILTGANLLFFLTIWLANKYDRVSLDQFIYQLKSSAAGANKSLAGSVVIQVGVFGLLSTVLEILLYMICTGHFQQRLDKYRAYLRFRSTPICRFIARRATPLVLVVLLVSMCFFAVRLDVIGYVNAVTTDSDFIENHYTDPRNVDLTFPEKKRNLIYIFLESLEVTFSDPTAGGPILDDYTPELSQLARDHINFSHTQGVGGGIVPYGATWTAAAMVCQTSGMIVQVPLTADQYGGENKYIPGLYSIGEILAGEGYRQVLLIGSDAEFAGRDTYFTEHGNYEIVDINALKEQGRLDPDYREWWGFEDDKLFDYAKEELTKLSQSDEPFNFTMLTADTHFPDGYVCPDCTEEYEEQYPNVLRCSSRKVSELIQWIQAQPFYENTTIVISGDHLTMDPDFMQDVNEGYTRTVYNCILNASVSPVQEKDRQFATYDMFPTTLAALGVKIPGNRLGLGTNLFSRESTLTEIYGAEVVDAELQKNSSFYNVTFLHMDT